MLYRITHTTTYTYDRPITLSPHTVRLRPRCDLTQTLKSFSLTVDPEPIQLSDLVDLDGNSLFKLWFSEEAITQFEVTVTSEVETHRSNPFNYLLDDWAIHLPWDYPTSLLIQLQPYLNGQTSPAVDALDPVAIHLAQEIAHSTNGNTISFLTALNQRIYNHCQHIVRETGDPFPPSITWREKKASCRDMTVLFIEVCRAIGLAARFVSGYQEGDPDWEQRHLHAWAEVYLPGGGWRGYDPTHGLAVGDRYVALVASPFPRYTMPIVGSIKGNAQSQMDYRLTIEPLSLD